MLDMRGGLGDVGWEGKSDVEVARDGGDAMEARRAPANPVALAGPLPGRQRLCHVFVLISVRSTLDGLQSGRREAYWAPV